MERKVDFSSSQWLIIGFSLYICNDSKQSCLQILYIQDNKLVFKHMSEKRFLTRSEFQVMLILWNLPNKGGFTHDILEVFEDPKPAYTTLATFLKILTKKGYVKSKKIGAMLYYVPAVSKEEYCKMVMDKAQVDYFDNDPVQFIRFIAENNTLTEEQKQAVKNLF